LRAARSDESEEIASLAIEDVAQYDGGGIGGIVKTGIAIGDFRFDRALIARIGEGRGRERGQFSDDMRGKFRRRHRAERASYRRDRDLRIDIARDHVERIVRVIPRVVKRA